MKTYDCTFFSDPGHGWLRVSRTLVTELGLDDRISHRSYERGKFAYLEEDVDAGLFMQRMTEIGRPVHYRVVSSRDRPSKIRRYPLFTPTGQD